jgi:hypothetical protein
MVGGGTSAQAATMLRQEVERNGAVAKDANIRIL